MKSKEYTNLYYKLKDHGVTIYAVAKAGGWSWQQVAAWCKGSRSPSLSTFHKLCCIMNDEFGIIIDINDLKEGVTI